MEATHRRQRLLEIIQKKGFSSLPYLVETLKVSESTVRRDLSHLERRGAARRTHGGAFYTGPSPHMTHFRYRQQANWGKKKAVATAAARLVEEGDTLMLDGGSTLYEVARLLVDRSLQVVTNSLPVANLFSGSNNVDLVLLGGYVHNRSGALHGEYTDRMLSTIHVRRAIMGAAGIGERGLFNSNEMLAATQRAMLRTAEQVIVVADSTKFGHQSLSHICELNEIDIVVVDAGLEPSWLPQLEKANIEVIMAAEEAAKTEHDPHVQ